LTPGLSGFQRRRSAATSAGLRLLNADLRSERGKLSANAIKDLFGITLTELGTWIGREKGALSKTPDAESLQELLKPFSDVAMYRLAVPGDSAFRKWLRTPNPDMRGKEPLQWIQDGRVRDVAGFVHAGLSGQPT